ncbi:MAG: hypothetical protein ACRCUY_01965 [Thermoguttaceae bacterium]
MNIWNTVFLVLVFLLAIVVAFFTAQELQRRADGNKKISSLQKKIAETNEKIDVIEMGADIAARQKNIRAGKKEVGAEQIKPLLGVDHLSTMNDEMNPQKNSDDVQSDETSRTPLTSKKVSEMSLGDLEVLVHDLALDRGKAWFGCDPISTEQNNNDQIPPNFNETAQNTEFKPLVLTRVQLKVPSIEQDGKEQPISVEDMQGIVYIFDEGTDKQLGAYLGRFVVAGKQGNTVSLLSADALNSEEFDLIDNSRKSKATWAVYMVMPSERWEGVFSRIEEMENQFFSADPPVLSEELIDRLKKHPIGQKSIPRDFAGLMTEMYRQRVLLMQEIEGLKKARESMAKSQEDADKEDVALRDEESLERTRISAMDKQVEVLQNVVDSYNQRINDMKQKLETIQKQNEIFVSKIAKFQLDVVESIEKRANNAAAQ